MAISAAMVKELREKTGAGMMDCKKALVEVDGDLEKAVDWLRQKGLSKAALAKQSGMSEIYLHQIFAGRRNPSRSRMLCLCFGLSASLEETQELLRLCGLAELYPKVRRDAIIIYGLLHGMDLFAVNDRLFSEDEETLF